MRRTPGPLVLAAAMGALATAAPARRGAGAPGAGDPLRAESTCAEDDPVPTPPGYDGWERSSVAAWEEIEGRGGVLPEIEEDPSQAPPGWWRYPSPLRSAALLAEEAKHPTGLYETVAPGDLKPGDLLVRARGAGVCGKMTVIAGTQKEGFVTLEPGPTEGADPLTKTGDPIYFDGRALRPEVAAYRIRVKKDHTLGHVRELERDLGHLEGTISERPPLVVKRGAAVVDTKVHDLIDEASSLAADPAFADDRRALTGRALALGAALDWPGAAEEAAAVLDDELRRMPLRTDAILARVAVFLLGGQADQAVTLAEAGAALPGISPRVHYLLARALSAEGKSADAALELRRYRQINPYDALAVRLAKQSAAGAAVPLAPAPPAPSDGAGGALRFSATAEHGRLASPAYDFRIAWPIAWRLTGLTANPDSGLLIGFATERVLRDDGEAERATVTVLAQRPRGAGAAATLARTAGRNLFPDAKLKPLVALAPGSRREQFREHAEGAFHQGEVTTIEKNGVVYFLVLNATTASYPKLKDDYAAFVKSFATGPDKPADPPKPEPPRP